MSGVSLAVVCADECGSEDASGEATSAGALNAWNLRPRLAPAVWTVPTEGLRYDVAGGGEPAVEEDAEETEAEAEAEAAAAWSAWSARIWFCLAARATRLSGAGMGCEERIEAGSWPSGA